jgi:glycosyltransferase involved in cell wall biosynthesis
MADRTDTSPFTIVLVGNCPDDGQESMLRFEAMLARELEARGVTVERVAPQLRLAKLGGPYRYRGWRKWAGYVDKYWSFPRQLRRAAARHRGRPTVFHIIDHSNAVYGSALADVPWLATCHDLLAVRGALGDREAFCAASRTGVRLQKWILGWLAQTPWVACVSEATRGDLLRLTRRNPETAQVIPLGINSPFHRTTQQERGALLAATGLHADEPYLLMVGSDLPRKNREAAIKLLARLGDRWAGRLVIAGRAPSPAQSRLAQDLGVADRILPVHKPAFATLNALYGGAFAFLFPSYAEGFGWPIIEAQACACPVICSDRTSVPEVAGEAALVCQPDNIEALAKAVLRLRDEAGLRDQLVAAGARNLARFTLQTMTDGYLACYRRALNSPR